MPNPPSYDACTGARPNGAVQEGGGQMYRESPQFPCLVCLSVVTVVFQSCVCCSPSLMSFLHCYIWLKKKTLHASASFIYTFSTWWQTRFLKRCFSIRFEWRSVPSRCFGCCLALRGVELHDDGWFFSPLSAAFFRPPLWS